MSLPRATPADSRRRLSALPATLIAAGLAAGSVFCGSASAAKITLVGDQIRIQGDIETGDYETFLEVADQSNVRPGTIVRLKSPGGLTYVGIRIGLEIQKRKLHTYAEGECTSACGLIWLGGAKRLVHERAKVGFHHSYNKDTKRAQGNALVGYYMRELGLGYEATLFVTEASARRIKWLTPEESEKTGIEYEFKNIEIAHIAPNKVPVPVSRPVAGEAEFEDGRHYSGLMSDGVPRGAGVMTWPDGSIYHGEWRDGERSGFGTFYASGGTVYSGNWKNDRKHGHGEERAPWGQYAGDYRYGRWYGAGVLDVTGEYTYKGEFINDRAHGEGELNFTNGDRYSGRFRRGLFEGTGRWSGIDKTFYSGDWKAGLRDGKGFENMPNGFRFSGQWKEGLRDGDGVLRYPDNRILKGKWAQGVKQGDAQIMKLGDDSTDLHYDDGLRFGRDFEEPAS